MSVDGCPQTASFLILVCDTFLPAWTRRSKGCSDPVVGINREGGKLVALTIDQAHDLLVIY